MEWTQVANSMIAMNTGVTWDYGGSIPVGEYIPAILVYIVSVVYIPEV